MPNVHDPITRDSLQIARLEEQMNTMRRDMEVMSIQMAGLQTQLGTVLDKLNEFRGGKKVMLALFAACGAAGGTLTWAATHIKFTS